MYWNADVYRERLCQRLSQRLWRTPKDEPEETPLFSLYRLYERIVLNDNIGMRNEIEYLFYAKWPVVSIPDPQDSSVSRYAVLSTIPTLLVESFNERIRTGLPRKADPTVTREELEQYQEERIWETIPEWTKQVPALKETLLIPHEDDEVLPSFEDERARPQLAAKNILHWQPNIHFI
ncbi:hypothetical protein BDV06DRAFT_89228 [Aspergillus oleicola]